MKVYNNEMSQTIILLVSSSGGPLVSSLRSEGLPSVNKSQALDGPQTRKQAVTTQL